MTLTNREKLLLVASAAASGAVSLFSSWRMARQIEQALRERDLKQEQHYRQTEALFSLFSQIQFKAPLPTMRAWAISPDFGSLIISQIRTQKPQTIVELGSGISTLISGYCVQQQGSGRVIAIDHDPAFAEISRANVREHGLADVVQIINAPLKPLALNGREWLWYDTAALSDLSGIDLLIVDGPPQAYNPTPRVRYPALPVLYSALNDNAHILMDDAEREDEKAIVPQWLTAFPLALVRSYDTERGAVLLRKY